MGGSYVFIKMKRAENWYSPTCKKPTECGQKHKQKKERDFCQEHTFHRLESINGKKGKTHQKSDE